MSNTVTLAAKGAVLDLHAAMSIGTRLRLAVEDIKAGLRLWRLAWALGWLDIRLRYRGSMLGPFWLTISTGVMVAALGVLYATLFHMNVHDYLPFLALSQVLWAFLASMVSESCGAFTEAEAVVRSVRMPFFVFALRTLIRNVIVLGHNILVIVVVFAWFSQWPSWNWLMMTPGLLVWIADALLLTLLLGAFCARFRDILPIVNSVMQIAFFVTPVIWKPEQLGKAASTLPFNPFYDLIEIVRGPLLGQNASAATWIGAGVYSLALCSIAWAFFVRARGRITFWI